MRSVRYEWVCIRMPVNAMVRMFALRFAPLNMECHGKSFMWSLDADTCRSAIRLVLGAWGRRVFRISNYNSQILLCGKFSARIVVSIIKLRVCSLAMRSQCSEINSPTVSAEFDHGLSSQRLKATHSRWPLPHMHLHTAGYDVRIKCRDNCKCDETRKSGVCDFGQQLLRYCFAVNSATHPFCGCARCTLNTKKHEIGSRPGCQKPVSN